MKSTSIISLGTLSSRILGFFRDVILAKIFGTSFQADALFLAFRIPNLFRDFVGEGATNAAVVPVFSEYHNQKQPKSFSEFISVVLLLGIIILSFLTLGGILLAPVIVRLIAPGFMVDPVKLELTIKLTKIIFPYLIFIGMTAYTMAVLHTHRYFTVPAFSPCLLNLSVIVSALLSARFLKEPVYGLAAGILIGGLLQLAVQIKPMFRLGVRLSWPKTLKHPGASKIGKLLIPRILGAGVYQLNVFIDTFCASLSVIVGAGGISAIYYANRIIQFPMGIFTFAIASAVLPTLSGLSINGELQKLKETLVFSIKNILFIMMPTTVILLILSQPIIRVLFERGEFNQYSTTITSVTLLFYSLGLFSFGGIKILVTAFYSLQDTRTPVFIALFCLVINCLLNFILMFPLKIGGIALASSISATVDFCVLFYYLEKRLGKINSGLKIFVFKTFLAAMVMGVCILALWSIWPFSHGAPILIFTILFGYVLFGVFCFQLKIDQAKKVFYWARTFFGGSSK